LPTRTAAINAQSIRNAGRVKSNRMQSHSAALRGTGITNAFFKRSKNLSIKNFKN